MLCYVLIFTNISWSKTYSKIHPFFSCCERPTYLQYSARQKKICCDFNAGKNIFLIEWRKWFFIGIVSTFLSLFYIYRYTKIYSTADCTIKYEPHTAGPDKGQGWGECIPGSLQPDTCSNPIGPCVSCTGNCIGLVNCCKEDGKWYHCRKISSCLGSRGNLGRFFNTSSIGYNIFCKKNTLCLLFFDTF